MRKLKRSKCAVLHLVLKRKWYDMIASGEKKEEYREIKTYWFIRLGTWLDLAKVKDADDCKELVVAFSRGYRKADMAFVMSGKQIQLSRRKPLHPEWGEPDTPHYIITLGERVELED